ncbi:MAG: hypothetical protein FD136_2009 [Chitinophagaceae bacterium]|nr:MAG: hypothetical protein FD136_2009 [Chitinophagaceae bacterium]
MTAILDKTDAELAQIVTDCKNNHDLVPFEPFDFSGKDIPLGIKKFIGELVVNKVRTAQQISDDSNLSLRTVQNYAHRIKNKMGFFNVGNIPMLTDNNLEFIKNKLFPNENNNNNNNERNKVVYLDVFNGILNNVAYENKRSLNIIKNSAKPMSRPTENKYREKMGAKIGDAEINTVSRSKAIADVRNALSHYVMLLTILGPDFGSGQIYNFDPTNFEIQLEKETHKVVYIGKRRHLKAVPKEDRYSNTMTYYIKYYLLINGDGNSGTPVFVVADKSMKKHAYDVFEIPGLGIGTTGLEKAYVVFCKSRNANAEFYEWYYTTVVIPFINATRPKNKPAYLQMDGEYKQILPFSYEKVSKEFKDNNIHVGKSAAATTERSQPADRGSIFKLAKLLLRYGVALSMYYRNENLIGALNSLLTNHYVNIKATKRMKFSNDHTNKLVKGLLLIRYVMNSSVNMKNIIISWEKSGIFPFSFEMVFSNTEFDTPLTIEEETYMRSTPIMNQLCKYMSEQGEITEDQFNELRIAGGGSYHFKGTGKPAINRRRAIILTHPNIYNQWKDHEPAKDEDETDDEDDNENHTTPIAPKLAKNPKKPAKHQAIVPQVQEVEPIPKVSLGGRLLKRKSSSIYDY